MSIPTDVYVSDPPFNAVGDGVTDDTAAIQAAINQVSGQGGGIVRYNKRHFVKELVIHKNVMLQGSSLFALSLNGNSYNNYSSLPTLLVSETSSIILAGSIVGCLITRAGITYPIDTQSEVNAFSGTAVQIRSDDACIESSMFLGFNSAIHSSGFQRLRLRQINIDCTNGVYLGGSKDISYIERVHCWPFLTVAQPSSAGLITRNGTAIRIDDGSDWVMLTNCFSYGYLRGIQISGQPSNTTTDTIITACAVDGTGNLENSVGFSVDGNVLRTRFVNCKISNQDIGILVNAESSYLAFTHINSCTINTSNTSNIAVQQSNVMITDCQITDSPLGVRIATSQTDGRIAGNRFDAGSGVTAAYKAISYLAANSNIRVVENDMAGYLGSPISGAGSTSLPSVVASEPLIIPNDVDVIAVTGNTGFSRINYGWPGRRLTIIFAGSPVLTENSSAQDGLVLTGSSFSALPVFALDLVSNGNNWFQVPRSS